MFFKVCYLHGKLIEHATTLCSQLKRARDRLKSRRFRFLASNDMEVLSCSLYSLYLRPARVRIVDEFSKLSNLRGWIVDCDALKEICLPRVSNGVTQVWTAASVCSRFIQKTGANWWIIFLWNASNPNSAGFAFLLTGQANLLENIPIPRP